MEDNENKSKRFQKQGRCLMCIAAALGIIATLRGFGTDGISMAAVAFLIGATVLAVAGLIRLSSDDRLPFDNTRKVFAILAGVHIVSTLFFFPPEDILNDRPVLTLDHAVHYYQVERAGEICPHTFCLYAYDPYFMAGHPGGTVFDIDSKGAELFSTLLRFMGTARALKLFVLFAHLLLVASIFFGCRRLGFQNDECAYATLLALAYWHWGRPYASDFRFAGMFAFLFVTHLSLYLTGLFRAFLDNTSIRRFFIIGPLTFLIHPTAAVLLPIPFVAVFLLEGRRRRNERIRRQWAKRVLLRLVLWCLLIVAVNAIWILPLVRYLDIKLPSEAFFQINGITGVLRVLFKPGNITAIGLCLLAAVGSIRLAMQRRTIEWIAPASAALFLLLLAAYGVYIPGFDQMEPGRFLYSAMIFLAPLSGAGLKICLELLWRASEKSIERRVATAVFISLVVIPPWLGMVSARAYYKHTLSTTMSPEMTKLIAELQQTTDSSGRLMVEDGPAWRYRNCHLPSILPLFTSVEQVGGPYPHTFIKHHFTTFQKNETMGKTLLEWDPGAFGEYIDLYNIRWILTASSQATDFINGLPGCEPIWSLNHFTIWRTPGRSSFADVSGVSVRAEYNRIDVKIPQSDGAPPPERIVLKYHWDRALEADPPARISQIMLLDDPVPFILLEPNGRSEVRIRYHY
jgi:hypothetical protein